MQPWKKACLAVALLPIFAVAFLETVPRFVPIPRLRLDDLDPYRDPVRKAWVQPHPYLAYAPKPSFVFEGPKQTLSHNALGFRGPEITWAKPAGTFRIACLGGSSTYGFGPTSNETNWPMRLEHYLRERYPERSIEVINGGCQGYSTFEAVQNLAHRMLPLDPDGVLVYHVINDVRCALYPNVQRDNTHWRAVWRQRQPTPLDWSYTYLVWRRYFTEELRAQRDIASFAIVNFDLLKEQDLYAWREGEIEIGLESYRRNLNTIIALAADHGARVMLATEGLRRTDLDGAPSREDQLRCFDVMTGMVEEIALARGVDFADVGSVLEAEAARQVAAGAVKDDVFTGEVHVTDKGADLIARAFFDAIVAAGWLGE